MSPGRPHPVLPLEEQPANLLLPTATSLQTPEDLSTPELPARDGSGQS